MTNLFDGEIQKKEEMGKVRACYLSTNHPIVRLTASALCKHSAILARQGGLSSQTEPSETEAGYTAEESFQGSRERRIFRAEKTLARVCGRIPGQSECGIAKVYLS